MSIESYLVLCRSSLGPICLGKSFVAGDKRSLQVAITHAPTLRCRQLRLDFH